MKKAFKILSKQKDKALRFELARAHSMIALLSIMLVVTLALGNMQYIAFDPVLSAIAAVLLILVAITSIGITIMLIRKKH